METKDFLDAVLPAEGTRCFGASVNGTFRQKLVPSTDKLVAMYSQPWGRSNVYFGCAGYGSDGSRKADNVTAVRSFWLDIDTQEGKPQERYANRRDALAEVHKFCEAVSLPLPMIVDSGYGLHLYWTLTSDIDPHRWLVTATKLKAATVQFDLAVDPTRTADIASILRPVGTWNYKGDNEPRPVRVIQRANDIDYETIDAALTAYVGDVALPASKTKGMSLNSDLMIQREFAPSDPNVIADHCVVVGEMRETRGLLAEPLWYGVLGVLSHTEGGHDLAHEWSKGHSGYDPAQVDAKLAQLEKLSGPTTCAQLNTHRPQCRTCKFWGKIQTPVELGREASGLIPVEVEIPQPAGAAPVKAKIEFPAGYGYSAIYDNKPEVLWYTVKETMVNEEGNEVDVETKKQLVDYLIYPTHRIADRHENYSMNLRLVSHSIAARDFIVDYATVSEGGNKLFAMLGSKEVNVQKNVRPQFERYLTDWIGKLREEYEATPLVPQFGWHNDGFIVGRDYITPSGTRKAVLSAQAESLAKHMPSVGELQPWVDAVNAIYNHPGDEPLQYCVLGAFAAPLWKLLGEDGGAIIHAYSADSGFGKTTAQLVGMSAFGNKNQLISKATNATQNYLLNRMGILNNMAAVVDEVTNGQSWFLSELAYAVADGQGKGRLQQNAVEQEKLNSCTIMLTSGNCSLTEKLAVHRSNASAEMLRVFEFEVRRRGQVSPNDAIDLFAAFSENYGVAGRVYMQYIVENYDQVKQMVRDMRKSFNTSVGIAQEERYWSMVNACMLTALGLTRKLGLLKFETAPLLAWIKSTLEINRSKKTRSVTTPIEAFGEMIADLSQSVLVTQGETSPANIIRRPSGQFVVGRNSLPVSKTQRETLYIARHAIKTWCDKNGVSPGEMWDAAVSKGWVSPTVKRVVLGKGTVEYSGMTGQVHCWDIIIDKIRADTADSPTAQRVTMVVNNDVDATGS